MIMREMSKKLEENPAPMPLSTLRISQSHTGLNPRLLDEKPAPNRRSYDRAKLRLLSVQHEGARGNVVGFVVDNVAGFLRVLRFPLSIFIPPISPQSPSPIIWGWYDRPVVAAVPKVTRQKFKKKLT
jgi:hypothetical protein